MKHTITYKNGQNLSYAEYGEKDGYPIRSDSEDSPNDGGVFFDYKLSSN